MPQHAYPASRKNSALRVSFLFYISMTTKTNKIPYPKHLISFTDQINLLKQRGMAFRDEPKALHLLQNISYYRLSGYWYPLLADKQQHIFKPGSTFELAYSIYKFDSELRKLIIAEIEKIEVAVRTQTAYILSSQYGAYWFEDSSLFSNPVIKLPANGTPQVYFVLSMIIYLLNTINPNHSFVSRFKALLNCYPSIDVRAMGFPDDWKDESLWKD